MTEQEKPEKGNQEAPEMDAEQKPAEGAAAETVTLSKADFDKMQKALKDANAEAAKRRKELEDKAKAEMTETERLKAELAQAQAERLTTLREAVAAKYNLPDVIAGRLQGNTREELEADAKALVDGLPKPTLKSPGPVGGNPPAKPVLTRDQIEKMSPEEINKNWDAVQAALSQKP